jgi:VanZ family protein
MTIHPDWRYGFVTAALLTVVYRLSSTPDVGTTPSAPLVLLLMNISHVPLFAILAFCWLKTVSGDHDVSGMRYGLAALATGACAALDEWHQSFVPGRHPSANDLLLDLAGIGGMLIAVHVMAGRSSSARRREPPMFSGSAE